MIVNQGQLRVESAIYVVRQCWPEMHADAGWSEGGSHPAPGSRPPVSIALLADRRRIADDCRWWADYTMGKRNLCPVEPFNPLDVMGSTGFLLDHTNWLGTQPGAAAALERVANLCELWAKGLHVRRIAVAPCPDCPGILYAILRQSDDVLPSVIRCDHEGHEYQPHAWDALGRRINGMHPEGISNLRRKMRHATS